MLLTVCLMKLTVAIHDSLQKAVFVVWLLMLVNGLHFPGMDACNLSIVVQLLLRFLK